MTPVETMAAQAAEIRRLRQQAKHHLVVIVVLAGVLLWRMWGAL